MSDRPKAPAGTFWRGDVLYGRTRQKGKLVIWSLHTTDVKVAAARRAARMSTELGVDVARLKRKVARLQLTAQERGFLADAIDAQARRRFAVPV